MAIAARPPELPGHAAAADAAPAAEVPAAVPRRVARWRPGTAVAAVLIGLALLLGTGLGVSVLTDSDLVNGAAEVLGDVLLLGVIVAFALRGTEHLGPTTFGLRRVQSFWRSAGWAAAFMFGVLSAEGLLALLIGSHDDGGGSGGTHAPTDVGLLALLAFAVAVAAPVAEETAFRGYLFPALTRWRGPWLGAILSSLAFGAAHAASHPAWSLPGLALFGFAACMVFWFTGSLVPGMLMHSLNNAVVLTFATNGRLAPAIVLAPLCVFGLVRPLLKERAPADGVADRETAVDADAAEISALDTYAAPVERVRGRGRRNGRAIAGLVCGVIGCLAFLEPIAALLLGAIALTLGVDLRRLCREAGQTASWQANVAVGLGLLAMVLGVAGPALVGGF